MFLLKGDFYPIVFKYGHLFVCDECPGDHDK